MEVNIVKKEEPISAMELAKGLIPLELHERITMKAKPTEPSESILEELKLKLPAIDLELSEIMKKYELQYLERKIEKI